MAVLRQLVARLGGLLRVQNWWFSKIPPLVAVVYLEILRLELDGPRAITLLAAFIWSVICVASYGHIINDIFDLHSDRMAGRPNAMSGIERNKRILLPVVFLIVGYLPALLADYSTIALLLLSLNYLWPTVYSAPPVRLKERGVLGVIFDAFGSHITPTLFALALFAPMSAVSPVLYLVVVSLWAAAIGIKGILHHQIGDLDDDLRSGTVTLATRLGEERCRQFLMAFNLLVELPISAALVWLVFGWCPLAAVGYIAYCAIESLKYGLGFQFALTPSPNSIRPSIPFTNELFYVLWLPMASATQLAVHSQFWLWLPLLHMLAFSGPAVAQWHDLKSIARAVALPQRIGRYKPW